jgi:RNA polymerase sigma-70 factor (ECF subfamily)
MLNAAVRDDQNKDEAVLLQQVASGSRVAFKILFDAHSTAVLNLSMRLTGNRDDAEEIAQDVFIALWKNAGLIRGDSKLSTWLYRVTMNRAINFRNRGGIFSQVKQLLSLDTDAGALAEQLPAPETAQPDRQLEQKRASVQVADLLAELPKRQREIYVLHKLEGLSYKEIADELRISLASVESVMHRAKENLRKFMVKSFKKGRK